ncbi:MAG: hypothetical protein QM638_00280, partial [Nocardioides sp.]
AIEAVETAQARAGSRHLRTAYVEAPPAHQPGLEAAVNAALIARDELLGGLGPLSLSVLAGMLGGMSQTRIAADLAVSASAVSQRVRRDGLRGVLRAGELLAGIGPVVDEAGVDEAGVDEAGVDQAGVDEAGVDQAGVDQAGVDESGPVR